jgi:hypothetical protein
MHSVRHLNIPAGMPLITAVILSVFMVLFAGAPLQAQENNGAISQGFETGDSTLVAGTLVSLETQSKNKVQAANTERAEKLAGIVGEKTLIELSGSGSQIQVVTSGTTIGLVSNVNGEVKIGDKITAAPINGVGMKATESGMIVGTAQEDFKDAKQVSKHFITDKDGKLKEVSIGLLLVQVNVTSYAVENEYTFLPPFMQGIANSVAGRNVSPIRILGASLTLFMGIIAIAVLLYTSIRSSIISIGRNPLSEGAVRKSLFQVGGVSIGILLVMLIAIYLILIT